MKYKELDTSAKIMAVGIVLCNRKFNNEAVYRFMLMSKEAPTYNWYFLNNSTSNSTPVFVDFSDKKAYNTMRHELLLKWFNEIEFEPNGYPTESSIDKRWNALNIEEYL